jgi:hypothetical protein
MYGGWQAAFIADFGKTVRIARKKYFCDFVRRARGDSQVRSAQATLE